MSIFLNKFHLVLELFINGLFFLFYALRQSKKLPDSWPGELIESFLSIGAFVVPVVIFLGLTLIYLQSRSLEEFFRRHLFSIVVFVPLIITLGDPEFAFWLGGVHLVSSLLLSYEKSDSKSVPSSSIEGRTMAQSQRKLRPAQLVALSFLGLIGLGSFLLALPFASTREGGIPLVDAVFMATSATCVTGLATLSVKSDFTIFGQIIILILIQVGGLGIMTLSSSMAILLGKSMGMKDRVIMQDLLGVSGMDELVELIADIVKYTLFIELWGAIILTGAFSMEGMEVGQALYNGIFHSISAFCNAGLSLFDNSLESFATRPFIHGTIALLISLGGLGFIVLKDLSEIILKKKSFVRLTLHSRVVLALSFVLTFSGFLMIFFGEFLGALDAYNVWEKVQVAFFQSVTLRTAGFNTVPLSSLHSYTLYLMCLFMFVGASPGSTGGGVKTTTLAIILSSIKSTLTGRKKVGLLDRSVPGPVVVKATAITFISIFLTSVFILILMKTEPKQSFLGIFFEAVSAAGTVGLSLGITPFLSFAGKVAISVLMLIGRIGPLTLVLAIGQREKTRGRYEYPTGRIMIG